MLYPTRKLADYIGRERKPEGDPETLLAQLDQEAAHMDPKSREYLQLQLKRRHQMQMIKRMLKEAGYDDLAQMTTVKKQQLEG